MGMDLETFKALLTFVCILFFFAAPVVAMIIIANKDD